MLALAKELHGTVQADLNHIEGHDKLARRIESEIKFLTVHPETPSSNITSLNAIVETALENQNNLVALLRSAEHGKTPAGYEQSAQVIDVVLQQHDERCFQQEQLVWVKVIARRGPSIHELCMGRSDSKNRNVIEQAIDLARISAENFHNFSSIKLVFNFRCGITKSVKALLEDELNICVEATEIFEDSYPEDFELLREEYFEDNDEIIRAGNEFRYNSKALNVDVTTMISYCSNLSNNPDNSVHDWKSTPYKLIAQQAESENNGQRVSPLIDSQFDTRQLIACRTAYNDFKDIVGKIGGPEERARAATFLERVQVVDDHPSEHSRSLPQSQKMSDRSVAIFGTGDQLNIPTITANVGFVRAASQNGVSFCVTTHEPRVLSEEKQIISFGSSHNDDGLN